MSEFKLKNADGSETNFTQESCEKAADVFQQMGKLFFDVNNQIAKEQMLQIVIFCRKNQLRADEVLLLAVDALYKSLVAFKKTCETKKRLKDCPTSNENLN